MRRQHRALGLVQIRALLAEGEGSVCLDYGDDIVGLLADLLQTDFAISTISERYFEGHEILFKEYRSKLREQIAEVEVVAELYNKLVDLTSPAPKLPPGLALAGSISRRSGGLPRTAARRSPAHWS
jgi:hypothetical protein